MIIDDKKRWVKVTGTRGRFIEFDFTVGDPDLTVELIMPYEAFVDFCRSNNISVLPVDGSLADALEKVKWRSRRVEHLQEVPQPSGPRPKAGA